MKAEIELKGTKDEKNGVILGLVNSGYRIGWETKKVGNVKRVVLVVEDKKEDKE